MNSDTTFQVFAAKWLERKARSFKPSTVSNIACLLGHVPTALTLGDIDLWVLQDIQESLKTKLCPARNNKVLMIVRQVFEEAVALGIVPKSPAEKLKLLTEKAPEIKPMLIHELESVLVCLPPQWQPLFTTMIYTGCRPGELYALRWTDVNFDQSIIYITKSRSQNGSEGSPKTASAKRSVPLLPQVRSAIAGLQGNESDHIFTIRGHAINRNISRVWRTACEKAGVDPRRSYEIRHSFGSNALLKSVPLPVVAKAMGHASVQTTISRYVRPISSPEEMREHLSNAFC